MPPQSPKSDADESGHAPPGSISDATGAARGLLALRKLGKARLSGRLSVDTLAMFARHVAFGPFCLGVSIAGRLSVGWPNRVSFFAVDDRKMDCIVILILHGETFPRFLLLTVKVHARTGPPMTGPGKLAGVLAGR